MDEDPLKKWFAWQRRQHTEKVTGNCGHALLNCGTVALYGPFVLFLRYGGSTYGPPYL